MHAAVTTGEGYVLSVDEADSWLERLAQVALEATGGRTPVYGDMPEAILVEVHAPCGRLLRGHVVWDDASRAWTVANDELGRFAWECSARVGAI